MLKTTCECGHLFVVKQKPRKGRRVSIPRLNKVLFKMLREHQRDHVPPK